VILSAVPGQFPGDRGPGPTQFPGDLRSRAPVVQQVQDPFTLSQREEPGCGLLFWDEVIGDSAHASEALRVGVVFTIPFSGRRLRGTGNGCRLSDARAVESLPVELVLAWMFRSSCSSLAAIHPGRLGPLAQHLAADTGIPCDLGEVRIPIQLVEDLVLEPRRVSLAAAAPGFWW
jgi:hypothetical protein